MAGPAAAEDPCADDDPFAVLRGLADPAEGFDGHEDFGGFDDPQDFGGLDDPEGACFGGFDDHGGFDDPGDMDGDAAAHSSGWGEDAQAFAEHPQGQHARAGRSLQEEMQGEAGPQKADSLWGDRFLQPLETSAQRLVRDLRAGCMYFLTTQPEVENRYVWTGSAHLACE